MKAARRHSFGALVVVLTVSLAGAACGLRTPVRPPEDTAPVIPGTPTVTRETDANVVRWKRAVRSADGMRLDDLVAFVVERKRGDDEWAVATTVDVVDQEKIRRRGTFSWRDTEAAAADASYRVSAVTADGQQGPPNEAVAAPEPAASTEAAATAVGTAPASPDSQPATVPAP